MSIQSELQKRILLLDGAMGTLLPKFIPTKLKNLDEAVITYPEIVEQIHQGYSDAGADILKTNTFNNSSYVAQAVSIARKSIIRENQFIAGVIGPVFYKTNLKTIVESFHDSNVDVILLETAISLKDTLRHLEVITQNTNIPVMVSITISQMGNALSGETPTTFLEEISRFDILSFGFNCSFGTTVISKALNELQNPKNIYLSAHPNHGLPEAPESEAHFFHEIESWVKDKKVNMIGGCCGTTPLHIERMKEFIL